VDGLIGFVELFFYIVPVFLVMGAGGLARWRGWLDDAGEQTLLKLVVNLLYPAFLFNTVAHNESLRIPGLIVAAVLTGFVFILLGYLLCYVVAPMFGMIDRNERRTFSFTGGIYNYGYFAFPVAEPLFGKESLGVLMVISVGVELAMWSVGVLIVSGEFNRQSLKRLVSPPILAIVIAVPINLMGGTAHFPGFFEAVLDFLGRSAIPIGLIMIGATIFQLMVSEPLFTRPQVAIGACLMRLGVLPAVLIGVYFFIPEPIVLREAALVHAVMPCGILPIVLTRVYGGRSDIALRTVIPTCLLSLVTIPLWIQLGTRVLGLSL